MPQMALLLATDEWQKLVDFQDFLSAHELAVWRSRIRRKQSTVDQRPATVSLYFFLRNIVRYRATCVNIVVGRNANFPLELCPPKYRNDRRNFLLGFFLTKVEEIQPTHISNFPKYKPGAPREYFSQGLQGLLQAEDIFAT